VRLFSKSKSEPNIEKIELFKSLDDMWLHNWQELNKSSDLKWLIRNEHDREKKVNSIELDNKFLELMDEWFELTKQGSNRKELYAIMRKLIIARNKVLNGDTFQMNWVNQYEQKIKDLVGKPQKIDPDKQRMELSLIAKREIDKHRITVVDYMKLTEVIIEQNSSNTTIDG